MERDAAIFTNNKAFQARQKHAIHSYVIWYNKRPNPVFSPIRKQKPLVIERRMSLNFLGNMQIMHPNLKISKQKNPYNEFNNQTQTWHESKTGYLATDWAVFTSLHPLINTTKVKMVRTFCHYLGVLWCIFCI